MRLIFAYDMLIILQLHVYFVLLRMWRVCLRKVTHSTSCVAPTMDPGEGHGHQCTGANMLRMISIQNGSLQLSMLMRYVMVIWIGEFRWQSLIMRVRESMRPWVHLSAQVCDIMSKTCVSLLHIMTSFLTYCILLISQ